MRKDAMDFFASNRFRESAPARRRARARRLIAAIAILAAALAGSARAVHADDSGEDTEDAPPAPASYQEKVTVTSTRLADREEAAREVPASTVVISRAEIAASGLRTVQELLARVAGAISFDQIGNGVQTTFDLRGFTGGGITVLLDGARLNDPRNNAVALETIQLDSIERIEIVRGASAATVGGGSAAGVVNIVTRAGAGPIGVVVDAGAGSFSGRRYGVTFSGSTVAAALSPAGETSYASPGSAQEGFDWLIAASREENDGFRDNADARLDRIGASAGYTFANHSRLSFSFHNADNKVGAPGALTPEEWEDDPGQAPFNQLDQSEVSSHQGILNWRSAAMGLFTFAANVSYLSRSNTALTTGRSAPLFGGFHFDSRVHALGGAAQATAVIPAGRMEHAVTLGAEGASGTSDAVGCGTFSSDLTTCDPASFLNSDNTTRRRDGALFLQDSIRMTRTITFLAGGRWDDTSFDYRESVPNADNDQDRSFTSSSWKAGLTWNPSDAAGVYAGYGESFAPPTVEDLFAFPGFGSNPDLDPIDAANYEIGARGLLAGRGSSGGGFAPSLDWEVSVFRTNLSNEIVFDPTPTPANPFGSSVNGGESRREGLEVTGSWRVLRWLNATLAYASTRATFENGPNKGNDVPLVPESRLSAATEFFLPRGVGLRVDFLHVGEQVLSNDDTNGQERLDGYYVVDARLAWKALDHAGAGAETGGARPAVRSFELFVEGKNLADQDYATRGIYAFDFSTSANSVFVTPAPGRRWFAGGAVTF
jgi:iron complex outermembrane receptor protein